MKGPRVWKDPHKEVHVGGEGTAAVWQRWNWWDPRTQREEDRSPLGPFWGWAEKVTTCPGRGESGCSTVGGETKSDGLMRGAGLVWSLFSGRRG